ncbi:MAG: hypothetical protein ABI968_02360 [Acidobacteriota bacterium]
MREHGLLNRVLLIYAEALRRLDARQELPPEPIAESAKIIRNFIEEYREKLEEDREDTVLFPALRGIASAHEYDALGEDGDPHAPFNILESSTIRSNTEPQVDNLHNQ